MSVAQLGAGTAREERPRCPVLGTASSGCRARLGRWENVFREGKKLHQPPGLRGKMSPTALATPRAEKSKGRRPGEQVFPCSLGGDPQEQSSTLGPLGNTTAEQVSIPRGNYGIWRAHAEARKRCGKEGVAERNCC